MSYFEKTLETIEKNKEIKEQGGFNCIPFGFDRFEEFLPGIMQGTYYIVTANSGVGKSQLGRQMFIMNPFEFLMERKDFNLKIFFFSLEESKEELITSLISNKLYRDYGIIADKKQLRSIGKKNILTDEYLEKIKEVRSYFEKLEDHLEVIDGSINPYGIYTRLREYAEKNGRTVYEKKSFYDEKRGSSYTKEIPTDYIPNDPNEYVLCIVDHISLLRPESRHNGLHQAIGDLSSNYFVGLRNRYNFSIVNIQQQGAESESKQFTIKGDQIEEKLEPSLSGLGNNRETQRDADVVIGLFAPHRYGVEDHAGYDINKLRDNYRSLSILKNRDGESDKRIGLYFDGRVNFFKELPRPKDKEGIEKVMKFIENQY